MFKTVVIGNIIFLTIVKNIPVHALDPFSISGQKTIHRQQVVAFDDQIVLIPKFRNLLLAFLRNFPDICQTLWLKKGINLRFHQHFIIKHLSSGFCFLCRIHLQKTVLVGKRQYDFIIPPYRITITVCQHDLVSEHGITVRKKILTVQ